MSQANITYEELEKTARAIADALPRRFGLRGWPGKTFTNNPNKAFWSEHDPDHIQIVVQIMKDGEAPVDFARTGVLELLRQMVRKDD